MAVGESELRLLLTARDEASRVLQTATGSVEKYGWSFERILKPALLGIAAVTGVATTAAVMFTEAAMNEQASAMLLTQALHDTGAVFAGEAPQAVETFIASLEHMSGFSRIEVMDALALLVEQTGSYTEAMTRETVAADFARGAHIDLWTASKLLGKVTDENVNVLARYGIHVAKGTSETELFALVMRKFGGDAAAYGQSVKGQWEILGNRIEDLKVKLGEKLLPVATLVSQRLTEFIENVIQSGAVEKFAESIRSMADSFFEAASRVGAFFADIQAVGLEDAIKNLIGDIVNKLKEELSKLGEKLDSMGPVGVLLKFALGAGAVSLGIGFLELLYGNLLGVLGKIAGVEATLIAATGPIGLAITAGLILGILVDQVIGEEGEKKLMKYFKDTNWWAVLLGVAASALLIGAGVPILLSIAIPALLVITLDTIIGQTPGSKQLELDGSCKKALGPNAYWDGAKCVVGAGGGGGTGTTITQSPSDASKGPAVPQWTGDYPPGPQPNCGAGYLAVKWTDGSWSCLVTGGAGGGGGGTPHLAGGGIVTSPTLTMIGEAGPEAVIPLGSGGSSGDLAGGGVTIENHFHGAVVGLDAVEDLIRQTVRDALASGGFRGLTRGRV